MGFCVDLFGISGKTLLKRCVGLDKRPTAYKQYKQIIKDYRKRLNENSCTKVIIDPTCEHIAKQHGFSNEALETLQSVEFMEAFHKLLVSKGYKKPYNLIFAEIAVPTNCGILGMTVQNSIRYNPRCLKTMDFRIPIHELGHSLTKQLNSYFKYILPMAKDLNLHSIGNLLKKIPYLKNYFKDWQICHLTRKEQEILKADLQRAWNEGFYRHNPVGACVKEGWYPNSIVREYRKNPTKWLIPNAILNRYEFIGDYFNLAARGFKFSPEITAKYNKYHGPEIKEIITEEDFQALEKLKKKIMKKTLADYGYKIEA